MLYTIYRVTHRESGKVYIGKHQTMDLNDGYMGSGKLVRAAIKKHGVDEFEKEQLYVFETEEEMNAKEAELVTKDFCLREDTYNLCPGGNGGWGYANMQVLTTEKRKINGAIGGRATLGYKRGPMSEEAKALRSASSPKTREWCKGNTYAAGTWITDEVVNRKIKPGESIPIGWRKGRRKRI